MGGPNGRRRTPLASSMILTLGCGAIWALALYTRGNGEEDINPRVNHPGWRPDRPTSRDGEPGEETTTPERTRTIPNLPTLEAAAHFHKKNGGRAAGVLLGQRVTEEEGTYLYLTGGRGIPVKELNEWIKLNEGNETILEWIQRHEVDHPLAPKRFKREADLDHEIVKRHIHRKEKKALEAETEARRWRKATFYHFFRTIQDGEGSPMIEPEYVYPVVSLLWAAADQGDPALSFLALNVLANHKFDQALAAKNPVWNRARRVSEFYAIAHKLHRRAKQNAPPEELKKLRLMAQQLAPPRRDRAGTTHFHIDKDTRNRARRSVNTDNILRNLSVTVTQQPTRGATVVGKELETFSESERSSYLTPDDIKPEEIGPLPDLMGFEGRHMDHPYNNLSRAWNPALLPEGHEFDAYDCSVPLGAQLVQAPKPSDCTEPGHTNVLHARKASFHLLQESRTTYLPIQFCALKRTIIPVYCGEFDYQTLNTYDMQIMNSEPISVSECRIMHAERKIKTKRIDHQDREHISVFQLKMNGTSQLRYDVRGTVWLDNNEVQCHGAPWWSESKQGYIDNMIVAHADDITLRHEEALVDNEGNIDLAEGRLRLPRSCPPERGHCTTEEGTYVWVPPSQGEQCQLFHTKTLTGEEVTVVNKGEPATIFNDDKEMVRLQKKAAVFKCGTVVHKTNFPSLYLIDVDVDLPGELERPLPAHEVRLSMYFNQQSGWLHGNFRGELRSYVSQLFERKCREEHARTAVQYAGIASLQASVKDGTTISLGQGMFATAAGEAWRRYRCRKVRVYGLNDDKCYNALPIQAEPAVHRRLTNQTDPTEEPEPLFMEPRTRILTTMASEVACSDILAPIYENVQGGHVSVTPTLITVAKPTILQPETKAPPENQEGLFLPDFQGGGIYTAEQLEDAESRTNHVRATDLAINDLGKIYKDTTQGHYNTLNSERFLTGIAKGIPELEAFWETAWFWEFISKYGMAMSSIVGTYCSYVILKNIWHCIFRCLLPSHGFSGYLARVAGALCPWLTSAIYENFHPDGQLRQARESRRTYRIRDQGTMENETETPAPVTTEAPSAPQEESAGGTGINTRLGVMPNLYPPTNTTQAERDPTEPPPYGRT